MIGALARIIAEFEIRADTADIVEILQCIKQLQALSGTLFVVRSHLGERVPAVRPFRDPPALIAESCLQGFERCEWTMHEGLLGIQKLVPVGLQREQGFQKGLLID